VAEAVVRLHTEPAEAAYRRLGDRIGLPVSRALNRSILSARTAVSRLVAKDMGLKVGTVRERVTVHNATPDHLVSQLTASPKRIPVYDFNARGPYPSRGRGRGVSARMGGGTRRYPHAFIAQMASGHRGVFQRHRTKRMRGFPRRQAIYELHGPSIAYVFAKHAHVGVARGEVQLQKNMVSELRFAIRAAGRRPSL
jgi:hypothetical protein